jgi:hypothetical protein
MEGQEIDTDGRDFLNRRIEIKHVNKTI